MLNLFLLRVVLGIHASSNKFCIIDHAVVVGINYAHGLFYIVYRQSNARHGLDTLLEFLVRQLAIAILIELDKGCLKVSNLGLRNPRCDVSQGSLPQLGVVDVGFEVADHIWVQVDQIILLISLILNPRVLERFLSR